ncbi:hypothetical protein L6R49_23075 [Myxococcota bacterium]|nr:hypothetical protein [Myxococcota bacterium]
MSWLYAAYSGPILTTLEEGRVGAALTSFTGLHPPLWFFVHALSERFFPTPLLWLGGSALASALGVFALRRFPVAAAAAATSAVQLVYAAEVNNYPLLALWVAALWALRERAAAGESAWALPLVGALAGWTHGLGGWIAGLVALSLLRSRPRLAGLTLFTLAVAAAPLLPGLYALMLDPGSRAQPPLKPLFMLQDAWTRFGPWPLLWLPLGLLGARRAPALAMGWVLTAGLVLGLQLAHVAAPHQLPYALALTAPWALLVHYGATTARARRLAFALAVLQGVAQLPAEGVRLRALLDDTPRGIDHALAAAAPDDRVLLLRPAPVNDDDKRRISPTLWRLRPWRSMPRVRLHDAPMDDFRYGQPRLVDGRVFFLLDEPRGTLETLVADAPTWIVVYDHGGDPRYGAELAARLSRRVVPVGADLVLPPR